MEYRTRITIGDSVNIFDSPEKEDSPYISQVKLKDSTALSNSLILGTSVSKQLTFSLYNSPIEVFDGQKIAFAIKHDELDSSEIDIDFSADDLTDEEIMCIFQKEDTDTDNQELTPDEAGSITDMLDSEGEEDVYLLSEEEETDDEVAFEEYDSNEVYREDEASDATDLSSETFEKLDEYTPMGEFYITQIQNIEGVYIITALDGFILMNGQYVPQVSSGTVAELHSDFIAQLETNLGIVCLEEPEYPNITIKWNVNTTYREAAGYFAGLLGGYATFDRSGALDIRQYMKNAEISFKSDELEEYQVNSDSSVMIGGMKCDTDISSLHNYLKTDDADSYYCIDYENPFITQSVLNSIYTSYYQYLEYTPARLVTEWDFQIQAGDLIQVDENWILITNQTIDFGSGITTIDSLGSTATLTDGQIEDPMTRKVQRVQTLIAEEIEADRARIGTLESDEAYLQKAVIQEATITDLSVLNLSLGNALANTLTAEKIVAVQTAITNASITNITSDNMNVKLATLDTALANFLTVSELNAVKAVIKQLTVENLAVNNLKAKYASFDFANVNISNVAQQWVKDLFVRGEFIAKRGNVYYLDSIHIDSDSIDVGSIKADRLVLKNSSDGLYYQLNLDALGQTTVQELGFEEITSEELYFDDDINPSEIGWYELVNEEYVLSADTEIIDGKTYYKNWQDEFKKSIHAKAITAGTITADKITVEDLVGTGGWINLRRGEFSYSDAESGDSISWIKNEQTGKYELKIQSSSLQLGNGVSIREVIEETQSTIADINGQMNPLPLYWDEEPHFTINVNNYPVKVNDEQIKDSNGNLLYWDTTYYLHQIPTVSTTESSYPVLDGDTQLTDQEQNPLYWSDMAVFVTTQNEHPVMVNSSQLKDIDENLLYWSEDYYYPAENTFPSYSAYITPYKVMDNGEEVLTANIRDLFQKLESSKADNTEIEKIADDLDETNRQLSNKADAEKVNGDIGNINEQIRVIQSVTGSIEVSDGIIIGDKEKSNIQITDEAVNFRYGETPNAWIDNEVLNITTADITYLRLGGFILEKTTDDGLILKER